VRRKEVRIETEKLHFSVRREIYDVFLDGTRRFFETQKEQKTQKGFHKRLLYVLRFTGMLQKKTFVKIFY